MEKKKRMSSGVFDVLKQDHRNVQHLFGRILKEHKRSDETFNEIKQELRVHMAAEEKFLYPVLENNEKVKDMILESYEEHSVGKEMMEKLEHDSKDDAHWLAKVKVLNDVIEHHIGEEEGMMFPKAKNILSKQQSEEITGLIQQEKSEASAGSAPGELE